MAYTLSKSNGSTLILLNDGVVDTSVSSINLIGKNVSNFGDAQNENFVRMLENFAYSVEPRSPLTGQLWFNSADNVLRPAVFDGVNWRPLAVLSYATSPTDKNINASGSDYAASRPGDFWFDSVNKQLHVVTSGTNTATLTTLIGPELVTGFDTTKLESVKMFDNLGTGRPVIKITLGGETIGIISADTFTPGANESVIGFSKVNRGITFKNYNSSTLYTTATTDVQLYGLHEQLNPLYVRRNTDEHLQSNWYVDNSQRLNFGTTAQSFVTWTDPNLVLGSTGGVRLQSNTTTLTFDGTSLVSSLGSVTLGTSTSKFNTVYVNTVETTTINATTLNATTVVANALSVASVTAPLISSTTINATTVTTNRLVGSTINATTLSAITVTAASITGTTAISTPVLNATSISATGITVNTASAVTVTADTFNGINFNGGIFSGTALYDNGSRVVTSATVANFELNAIRLKGEGATGYVPAQITNIGNTVVQRTAGGDINATTLNVDGLSATTGAGVISGVWTLATGASLQATYADLAENYQADAEYAPGTVLEFGGEFEVTVAEDSTRRVAGVVSSNPAYVMNSELTGMYVTPLALQGRVPCKVRGKVQKGDMMVSAGSGFARAEYSPILGSIIGKALQNFDGVEGVIEVVVGRL